MSRFFLTSVAKNTSVTMPCLAERKRDPISNEAAWHWACDGLLLVLFSGVDQSRYELKHLEKTPFEARKIMVQV